MATDCFQTWQCWQACIWQFAAAVFMPLGSVLTNLGTGSIAEATPIWHCRGTDHASQAGFHPVLVSLLMPAESSFGAQALL